MKQTITAFFILISFSAFSQALPKQDSIKLTLTLPQLQFIYQAVDAAHGDHVLIKEIMQYMVNEVDKQLKPKTDTTGKKKP